MASRFLRKGLPLLVPGLLSACSPQVQPLRPPPGTTVAPQARLASPLATKTSATPSAASVRAHFRKVDWPLQEKIDAALVVACVRLSQRTVRNLPAHTWIYAGKGTYRPKAPRLPRSPACWDELRQVFLDQARSTSLAFFGKGSGERTYRPNAVVLYSLISARWASGCSERVVDAQGLEHCLSSRALHPVAKARRNAEAFLGIR